MLQSPSATGRTENSLPSLAEHQDRGVALNFGDSMHDLSIETAMGIIGYSFRVTPQFWDSSTVYTSNIENDGQSEMTIWI